MSDYKDPSLPVDERVDCLLATMTLKEEVGQLRQPKGWNAYVRKGNDITLSSAFKEEVAFGDGLGAMYGLFRADPWSGVTVENGIPPEASAHVANMVQRYVLQNTRLGIPVLLCEECSHEQQALGGTVLPTSLGMASA